MSNGNYEFIQEIREFVTELSGVLDTAREILDQKENEEIVKHRDSEDLFIVSNSGGIFIVTNAAMAECLGYTKYGLLAQSWAALLHPDDFAERTRAFEIITRGGIRESDNVILRYRHRDGHYVRIQWVYSTRWVGSRIIARGKCLGPEARVETIG